jgi:hypothetical protein
MMNERRGLADTPNSTRILVGCLCVALLALTVLIGLSQVYETDHLYVAQQSVGLNDQAGYITTARWLAETGELRSHLIYPAYVEDPRWRYYMPGPYYALAAAYALFGDSPLTWRLPGLFSFIVASVGSFLIGRRFFGERAGLLAAVIFMWLPMNGAFAFTAMPQLPFIATGVVAFAIFSYLPERSRALWVPLLLIAPFHYRETGALLVVPMTLIAMRGGRFGPLRTLAIAGGGSVLCLSALLAVQIAAGKGSPPITFAVDQKFNGTDAIQQTVSHSLEDWVVGLAGNARRNAEAVATNAAERWAAVEPLLVLVVLAAIALFHPNKTFAIATNILVLTVFGVVILLYDWNGFRGTRSVLFVFPYCAVAASPVLLRWVAAARDRMTDGRGRTLAGLVPWLVAIPLMFVSSLRTAESMAAGMRSTFGAGAVEKLERIDIDQDRLLVSPYQISLDYALAHYPIRWSFVPANAETLRKVDEAHEIGTFIARPDQIPLPMRQTLNQLGFRTTGEFDHQVRGADFTYYVFQRASRAKTGRTNTD